MPTPLTTPILRVDGDLIHRVDPSTENLFGLWSVFSRCQKAIDHGRRLENLSWRLWNRETFCCKTDAVAHNTSATSQPRDIQQHRSSSADELPQLSGSVDSVIDEEAVEFTADSAPRDIVRPRIRREDSYAGNRSRGKERHITSDDLEKIVVSIIEAKDPLTSPLPTIPSSIATLEAEKTANRPQLERSGSTTTESPCQTSGIPSIESLQQKAPVEQEPQPRMAPIVTRGFSPVPHRVSRIIHEAKTLSPSAIPHPTEAPAPKIVPHKKQPMFEFGAASSGSGDELFRSPPPMQQAPLPTIHKKKVFQIGVGSSEEESLAKSPLPLSKSTSLHRAQKKPSSVSKKVETRSHPTSAIISDDDDSDTDYIDESAIDDDDDHASDWEDSNEDSIKSSGEEGLTFKRVDSQANLTSRRSLITLALAQDRRASRLGNNASQSTSALSRARSTLHGPSLLASPNDADESSVLMKRAPRPLRPINEIPRSAAQPIATPAAGAHYQAALSPRTTRRNMLATELTESLRRQLLWERSQKSSTVNAVLKRRHTSNDVKNLKKYPGATNPEQHTAETYKKKVQEVEPSVWRDYYDKNQLTGYNAEGW